MEMASANVENVNVTKVMLESFVLANLMNVQYRKKTVKFAVAMENVTHVLPTEFLDVPVMLVGLDLCYDKLILIYHIEKMALFFIFEIQKMVFHSLDLNPSDWSGKDCSCDESEDKCKDALSGKVCSENGKCKCGKCECDSDEFSGKFCQKKTNSICEAMGPCIMGKIESSDDINKTCSESYKENKFGKDIYKLCQKKNKESKETYYIYVIDADECSDYGHVTGGSEDCFAMVEGVGGGEFEK